MQQTVGTCWCELYATLHMPLKMHFAVHVFSPIWNSLFFFAIALSLGHMRCVAFFTVFIQLIKQIMNFDLFVLHPMHRAPSAQSAVNAVSLGGPGMPDFCANCFHCNYKRFNWKINNIIAHWAECYWFLIDVAVECSHINQLNYRGQREQKKKKKEGKINKFFHRFESYTNQSKRMPITTHQRKTLYRTTKVHRIHYRQLTIK